MEPLLFKSNCYSPFTIKHESNYHVVPCGRCSKCFKKRISMWSFRLMQEDRHSLSSHFITLTYDTKYVPITPKGYLTLNKRDIQLFMKRLRKDNKEKLKYYLCGEYGGQTKRPHYHMIIFNVDIKTLQENWAKGQIHYGQVSEASVGYTLKYMMKEKRVPEHQNDDREKEFSLMSKGLGLSYLTKQMKEWHKADLLNRVYLNIPGNKKIPIPRYYKDKLYDREERLEIKNKFTNEFIEQMHKMNDYPELALNMLKQIYNSKKHDKQKIKHDESKRGN